MRAIKTGLWYLLGGLLVIVLLPEVIPIGAMCGLIHGFRRAGRTFHINAEE